MSLFVKELDYHNTHRNTPKVQGTDFGSNSEVRKGRMYCKMLLNWNFTNLGIFDVFIKNGI